MSPIRSTSSPGSAMFGLVIVNGRLVRQGLENFGKAIPDIARARMWKVMQNIYRRMGVYPPQRPYKKFKRERRAAKGMARPQSHSHPYIRTFQLRDKRYITREGDTYTFVNNPVSPSGRPYSVFVRGDAGGGQQARVHKSGGWELMGKIVSEELATLPPEIVDALAVAFMKEAAAANAGIG